jgi:hypothetical protein
MYKKLLLVSLRLYFLSFAHEAKVAPMPECAPSSEVVKPYGYILRRTYCNCASPLG